MRYSLTMPDALETSMDSTENQTWKCYRVWCGPVAALLDAYSEQNARDTAQQKIDEGEWSGPITKIECLDD